MELIVPSLGGSGVDEINLQKQQQEEGDGKSQTVKRVVAWPEFKVSLPDPVLGKFGFWGTFLVREYTPPSVRHLA